MTDVENRKKVLDCARSWIGTPYCHQATRKGAGCDCLGFVRGVWREVFGDEPTTVPPYTPNWAEESGRETLLEAAREWLNPIQECDTRAGDVVLFRMSPNAPCKHLAILSGPTTMIHAYWGRSVTESHIVPYWARRWAYSFSFPSFEET